MERQSRFDEAMRAKLGILEDEPSGRVWQGVSREVGTIRPPQASPWIFRVAAAIALLAVVGLGYIILSKDAAIQSAQALHARSKARHIRIVPLDRMGKSDVFITQHGTQEDLANPQHDQQQVLKPSLAQNPAPAPKFGHPAHDSLDRNAPSPLGPGLDPSPIEKIIANQDMPQRDPSIKEGPQNQTPDAGGNQYLIPVDVNAPSPKAIASTSTKRSFRMPGRDDLTSDNLRRKSGAILGAVTNGANELLGLDAHYNERQEDDLKMTAFNADFGLFKIKRVKTVKH